MRNLTVLKQRPKGTQTITAAMRLTPEVVERVIIFARREMLGLGLAYEELLLRALDDYEREQAAESEVRVVDEKA